MTIKQLITKLNELPQDYNVVFHISEVSEKHFKIDDYISFDYNDVGKLVFVELY
jgi:hypothetical protein